MSVTTYTITISIPSSAHASRIRGLLAHRLKQLGESESLLRLDPIDSKISHLDFDWMDGESATINWVNS